MKASIIATKLLNRVGHKMEQWSVTKLGWEVAGCSMCDAVFTIDGTNTQIRLMNANAGTITSWSKTYVPDSSDFESFVRQALNYPFLFCLRLQVMV